MDPLTIAALALALVAVAAAAVVATRARALRELLAQARAGLEAERSTTAEAAETLAKALSERTEARTRLQEIEARGATLAVERDDARTRLDAARAALAEANQAAAVEVEKREATERRLKDWEEAKAEFLNHSKAAVLTTAQEVSSKLIADTKRENVAAKKETEERIRKTTADLTKHFEGVAKSVSALHGQVSESRQTLDTVWQALSTPGGAGYYSQIGLENVLKSFGLERGRDFAMEHTIDNVSEGRRLRPDAVVFLPYETVLVIDSKASKFLLELAQVEGGEGETEAYANLARSMNQHLKDLNGRDYKGAIVESYRGAGRAGDLRRVISVMYLPNEGAIERLDRADPDFAAKAAKAGITIAGPTGLSSIIGFACVEIDLGRQAENQEKIVESTERLLESVGVVLGHVDKVGKGIKSAAANFSNLTGSINQRLLPRARGLADLGVRPTKNRKLPNQMPQYQVVDLAADAVIEGEAAEVEAMAPPALADRANHKDHVDQANQTEAAE